MISEQSMRQPIFSYVYIQRGKDIRPHKDCFDLVTQITQLLGIL